MAKNNYSCHGCKSCHYSAPDGQHWNRAPHSRCLALGRDIPMVLGDHGKWLASEVRAECPVPASARDPPAAVRH